MNPVDEIRLRTEAREREWLSHRACLAANSAGRLKGEEPDPIRTCFQQDRDRVLHSKAFRRLKHKTQVFIAPTGDHYRTRLTHTLEVAQISRTVGRALRLNEDLIEAIALAHDVGHTPFGHAGEQAIHDLLQNELSHNQEGLIEFHHYDHSLRIVSVLENLNLTQEVLAGIGGHSKGRKDLSAADGEITSTLEAAVVRICDRIAYLSHDLDDALRSGVIDSVPQEFAVLGSSQGSRIGYMVSDLIKHSDDRDQISLSAETIEMMNQLKEWLFENVYLKEHRTDNQIKKAIHIVKELVLYYCQPGKLPEGFVGTSGAIDYVAGMTDRFAIRTYTDLFVPTEFGE